MDVYMYQADLYCTDCGEKIKEGIQAKDPLHWAAKQTDSDDYPQGPYPNGGGEADTPQYCGSCGCFLENPLTSDGYNYVEEAIRNAIEDKPAVDDWFIYYGFSVESSENC